MTSLGVWGDGGEIGVRRVVLGCFWIASVDNRRLYGDIATRCVELVRVLEIAPVFLHLAA